MRFVTAYSRKTKKRLELGKIQISSIRTNIADRKQSFKQCGVPMKSVCDCLWDVIVTQSDVDVKSLWPFHALL